MKRHLLLLLATTISLVACTEKSDLITSAPQTSREEEKMYKDFMKKEGEVLMRPQVNERDVEIPIATATPHFYDWTKVKELAYERLA
mgnify:CR=1 FL=1